MADPEEPNGPKPDDLGTKAEKLADEALEAGRKFVQTDTGKRVAEATDTAFAKAEELAQKARDSDIGKQVMESEFGRKASEIVAEASESTKKAIPNTLGRNVAVGAAAGAVIAIPLPIIGPFIGALIGGGLGYLRTVTKKQP